MILQFIVKNRTTLAQITIKNRTVIFKLDNGTMGRKLYSQGDEEFLTIGDFRK